MSHVESIKTLSKRAEYETDQAQRFRTEAEQARALALNLDAKADQADAQAREYEQAIAILEFASTPIAFHGSDASTEAVQQITQGGPFARQVLTSPQGDYKLMNGQSHAKSEWAKS